jgi:hypothetical protein
VHKGVRSFSRAARSARQELRLGEQLADLGYDFGPVQLEVAHESIVRQTPKPDGVRAPPSDARGPDSQ